jgi:hypothetical protein
MTAVYRPLCVWAKVMCLKGRSFFLSFSYFYSFSFQNGGSGGGEIERNESGVGSETSGTAQRLRRMRRLNKSSAHHQPTHTTTEGSSTTTLPSSGQDGPAAIPWCVVRL